jgi:hypothetical protein
MSPVTQIRRQGMSVGMESAKALLMIAMLIPERGEARGIARADDSRFHMLPARDGLLAGSFRAPRASGTIVCRCTAMRETRGAVWARFRAIPRRNHVPSMCRDFAPRGSTGFHDLPLESTRQGLTFLSDFIHLRAKSAFRKGNFASCLDAGVLVRHLSRPLWKAV